VARLYEQLLERLGRVGLRWRLTALAVFVLVVVTASVAGYRQWHYMQHDNTFCTSCHLMRDPFERFTRSAHAKLECHNCHKGKISEQLHQLYATLVDRPTEITTHADVPNQVCGSCHIAGDSTRWRIIASTAGHRRHLESNARALREVRCTTCHGVSVHEFAPVDRTCGQAGCHATNLVRLGKMGQMSDLHCTTCHNFLAEARTVAVDSLGRPLTPAAMQCFSCHAMQQQFQDLEIGRDPHRGICGTCHNPHRQSTPQEISCTSGACHAGWRTVSFHVGIPHPERCTTCHQRHSWRVEGGECTRCHADIEREVPTRRGRAPARRTALHVPSAIVDVATASAAQVADLLPGIQRGGAARALPRFSHGDHRGQRCATCHSSRVRHGELIVRSATDCQRCHHSGAGREQCATCHSPADLRQPLASRDRAFRLAAGRATVSRRIPFEHPRHAAVPCAQCHTDPVSRSPGGADCASCHASHHQAASDCTTCHAAASALAKHSAADHPNCATASCHGSAAAGLPASREACLICHTAQARHVPGRACEQCHRVMAPEAR